jgi:hypothetical protein
MYESAQQLTVQSAKMEDNIFEPYAIAEALLRDDNLVWDRDFDTIRSALAAVMHECTKVKNLNPWLLEVAYRLIDSTRKNA